MYSKRNGESGFQSTVLPGIPYGTGPASPCVPTMLPTDIITTQKNPSLATLLEIQQDIYRVPIGIGPQPVTALGVMDGHFAENFRFWPCQDWEQLLEVGNVEYLTWCELPCMSQLFFCIKRKAGDNHFTHAILGAFHDVDAVRNLASGVLKIRLSVELGVQISPLPIFQFNILP